VKLIPIFLVIISGLIYHISQKSTPTGLNPIIALVVTYVIASIISIFSYFIFLPQSNINSFISSLKTINWTSITLGFAVVGLELGFLLAYRAGFNISLLSLLTNSLIAIFLIPIGILFFKEMITLNSIVGAVLCILGLILITK
jgi:drug/metabolite transporter (DMT)-like permease